MEQLVIKKMQFTLDVEQWRSHTESSFHIGPTTGSNGSLEQLRLDILLTLYYHRTFILIDAPVVVTFLQHEFGKPEGATTSVLELVIPTVRSLLSHSIQLQDIIESALMRGHDFLSSGCMWWPCNYLCKAQLPSGYCSSWSWRLTPPYTRLHCCSVPLLYSASISATRRRDVPQGLSTAWSSSRCESSARERTGHISKSAKNKLDEPKGHELYPSLSPRFRLVLLEGCRGASSCRAWATRHGVTVLAPGKAPDVRSRYARRFRTTRRLLGRFCNAVCARFPLSVQG